MDCKQNGSITELLVIAELMKYGIVSIPYGNNARYDCIFDFKNKRYRIQIKTANMLDAKRFIIPFKNKRLSANGSVSKTYTKDQVDFIATIVNGVVYMVPVTGDVVNSMTFRLDYPSNCYYNINLASDYKLDSILNKINIAEQTGGGSSTVS